MKKYIFTEEQIKKVVDHVINEQSTDIRSTVMMTQCFLNHPKVMGAKLVIDGKSGPGSLTERALKLFQQRKKIWPVDGVWGYQTQSTLTPFEQQVWEACRKKYEIR